MPSLYKKGNQVKSRKKHNNSNESQPIHLRQNCVFAVKMRRLQFLENRFNEIIKLIEYTLRATTLQLCLCRSVAHINYHLMALFSDKMVICAIFGWLFAIEMHNIMLCMFQSHFGLSISHHIFSYKFHHTLLLLLLLSIFLLFIYINSLGIFPPNRIENVATICGFWPFWKFYIAFWLT